MTLLIGTDASERIVGTAQDDSIVGGLGADTLYGGAGADTFGYASASESPTGDVFHPTFDVIADFQRGMDSIDLRGAAGGLIEIDPTYANGVWSSNVFFAPNAQGAAGGAIAVLGASLDASDILADPGTSFVINASNHDFVTLRGGPEGDVLTGSGYDQEFIGGGGADLISPTSTYYTQTVVYQSVSDSTPSGFDTITQWTTGDTRLDLTAVANGLVELAHRADGGVNVFYDPLPGGGAGGAISIDGFVQANDVLAAPGTNFIQLDGAASETLDGGSGMNIINGGGGNDTVDYFHSLSAVTVDLTRVDFQPIGSGRFDQISGVSNVRGSEAASNVETGDGGANALSGGSADDSLYGGDGGDTLFGGSYGVDLIWGGAGSDTLYGGAGHLDGGVGDDVLYGGFYAYGGIGPTAPAGPSTLEGGDGADTLTWSENVTPATPDALYGGRATIGSTQAVGSRPSTAATVRTASRSMRMVR